MAEIKVGLICVGNVNGATLEVVNIEHTCGGTELIILKDFKTGKVFQYGLEALKRCYITILE